MKSTRRKTPTSSDPILERYAAQFEALRAEVATLGFFCKGTVLARRMRCGKATCACQSDPAQRHGPYFEWSHKVKGKTVSLHLQPEEARVYQEGTAQWRQLRTLLGRMENLSRRAIQRKAKIRKQLRPAQRGTISKR
jgi:hypothetical protein